MFGMGVPEHYQPIISATIVWIEGYHFVMKQLAFDRIKRKILKDDLKRIHKNNFESVGSQDKNFSTSLHSNYVSINDFRPIEQNYSSIKILDYQTHGLNNDIRINNAKKIEYTSNQLLPKEDFLEEWMIRQPISNLLPQKYPLSDLACKKIAFYHEEALSSVRKITFLQYTKRNLRNETGIFAFTERNPLNYKKDVIMNSLTILPEEEVEKALQIFELIIKIGGQIESQHHYLLQIDKILDILIRSNDSIKQEIIVQIIKQISSRKEVYLRLLCCLCYFMKPTTKIYIPLLNFLYEEATIYENHDKQMLNYCFYHLIKNFDIERKYTPSLFEIFCAFNTRKIPITICFPKEKVFFIEGFTTVEDFINEIVEYYNLDQNVPYLLQINGYLMQKGLLLEQLNKYSYIEEDEDFKWTDYKKFSGYRAVIVLKNVIDIRTSFKCMNLMYNYIANQYLRGVYALRSQQMVQLAALKMHSEADEDGVYEFSAQNLITRRKLHFMKNKVEREKIIKHTIKEYSQIKHLSKQKARREFMRILSKSRGFNTHYFRGYSFVEELDEIAVWIGVQKDRFLVIQPSSGRIMNSINYNKIREWGKSASQICLKVDGMNDIHLQSKQILVICSVFENYVEHYLKLIGSISQ